jgi:F0F1-type ATP synthase membrane subunit b/b'
MNLMFGVFLLEWREWLNTYFNYPGLEVWKFLNLGIFLLVIIKLAGKPLGAALASRRERIQAELAAAQMEKDAALANLAAADSLLARREDEISNVAAQARQEAVDEKERLANAATSEIEKLKIQGQRQIEQAGKVARKTLRQFLADRSIQLARESVRQNLRPEDDVRLVTESISGLGRNRA